EAESAEPQIHRAGLRGLALWPELLAELDTDGDFHARGSLVVAHAGDRADYRRFADVLAARLADGEHCRRLDAAALAELEPELGGRFAEALYLSGEAWLDPLVVMAALAERLREAGVAWRRAEITG